MSQLHAAQRLKGLFRIGTVEDDSQFVSEAFLWDIPSQTHERTFLWCAENLPQVLLSRESVRPQ